MTEDIHPDAVDPEDEFKNHIERLVMEARNAGVDDFDISQALRDEARSVDNDDSIEKLFA